MSLFYVLMYFGAWATLPYEGLVEPKRYICYRAKGPINVDGRLEEESWRKAPVGKFGWIDTGEEVPYRTEVRMLWDDENLYFGFRCEDPDVWSEDTRKDTRVWVEEDVEIFLDPDWDERNYYELEINPKGTVYDVIWTEPLGRFDWIGLVEWDFDGSSAVRVEGTLNEHDDTDRGWTVEVAIPWVRLSDFAGAKACPPEPGDQWRANFSRVERNFSPRGPSRDWTWTPQIGYWIHMPRRYGYVQFSGKEVGEGDEFIPRPEVVCSGYSVEGRLAPYENAKVYLSLRNIGEGRFRGGWVRLLSDDGKVKVIGESLPIGPLDPGEEGWSEGGFLLRPVNYAREGTVASFKVEVWEGSKFVSGDRAFLPVGEVDWRMPWWTGPHWDAKLLLQAGGYIWGKSLNAICRWDIGTGKVEAWSVKDGLPRRPGPLLMDRRGKVWVAGYTVKGDGSYEYELWTWDGRWRRWKEGWRPGRVLALYEDRRGWIWIGTEGWVQAYDGMRWREADSPGRGPYRAFAETSEGLYVADLGGLCRLKDGRWERFPKEEAEGPVLGTKDGSVWVGTYQFKDGKWWRWWLGGTQVSDICEASDGSLWFGHENGASRLKDGIVRTWTEEDDLPVHKVTQVLEDVEGNIWIVWQGTYGLFRGRNSGVGRYDGRAWKLWTYREGLPGSISSLLLDDGGRIWVGGSAGLTVYIGSPLGEKGKP